MPSASGGMRTAQETVALSLSHDGWGRAAGQSWSKVLSITLVGRDMESTNEPLEGFHAATTWDSARSVQNKGGFPTSSSV